jgi:tetratricopeptide (TPR) repeat protein
VHIDDAITKELRTSARPGKGDILVKVFSEAVAAYVAGDLGEAIRLGEQAKHMALRSPNAREFLGLVFYAAERYQEAVKELGAFRRLSGLRIQNHVLADSYRAIGKPDKALEYCDEVRYDDVGDEVYYEVQIVSAGALTDLGRISEAITVMQKLNLEPENAQDHHVRAWYVLGDLLERAGKFTQARKWFEAVVGADPEMTDAPDRVARLTASS